MLTGRSHQAFLYHGRGRAEVIRVPTEVPARGGILVAFSIVGVCGTDLDILRGARDDDPGVPGHEGVARVVMSASERFACGRMLAFNPVSATDQRRILGHTFPGLWQQMRNVTADELDQGLLTPCAANICPYVGTLIEPLGTVIYGLDLVLRRLRPTIVVIIGGGVIGLLYALEARRRGVSSVLLLNTSRARLQWAVEHNIVSESEAIEVDPSSKQLTGALQDFREVADAVFLCVPRQSALAMLAIGVELLRPGGVIDLVGGIVDGDHSDVLPGADLNAIRRANVRGRPRAGCDLPVRTANGKPIYLTGHRGTGVNHLCDAMKALAAMPAYYARLITHIVPLIRAPDILYQVLRDESRQLIGRHRVKIVLDVNGTELEPYAFGRHSGSLQARGGDPENAH